MNPTKLFVEQFWHSGGGRLCANCKKPSLKSLCPIHLKKAKIGFRIWTKERIAKKRCVKCNCGSLQVKDWSGIRQGVYCKEHRKMNRASSLNWMRQHRIQVKEEGSLRKKLGICVRSNNHGRANPGNTYCLNCLKLAKLKRKLAKLKRKLSKT